MSFSKTLLCLAAVFQTSIAGYVLQDHYAPSNFFDGFDFFTEPDPTNGFVEYVDQGTAAANGLIHSRKHAVHMGVDHTNVTQSGRQSVRITSKKTYNHGLIVLDASHMPVGCGTWPAFWTVGPSWPSHGEIDIIEGVNMQSSNAMTMHTGPGCSINNGGMTGNVNTYNCDVDDPSQPTNAGCSIDTSDTSTYGTGFNAIKGGVYAMDWTSSYIAIYFFPRHKIPSDLKKHGSPNPSSWGTPLAYFSGCDMDNVVQNQQIVFDTTFCGQWAGNAWNSDSTCSAKASSCEEWVGNNPSAFKEAHWKIHSLKVYQNGGSAALDSSNIVAPGKNSNFGSDSDSDSGYDAAATTSSVYYPPATTSSEWWATPTPNEWWASSSSTYYPPSSTYYPPSSTYYPSTTTYYAPSSTYYPPAPTTTYYQARRHARAFNV